MIKKIKVIRVKDIVEVWIMKNKSDGTYSFVNITKGHICPCRFSSVEEAINDLYRLQKEGSVIKFYELPAESEENL